MSILSLHEHCVNLGFQRGTKEYKKAYEAEKWRRLPYEIKKKYWKRSYLTRKQRLKENESAREKVREYDRKRKVKKRLLEREKVNEQQRTNYKNGGEQRKQSINDGKRRRDPTIGLASLIRDVKSGKRHARELIDSTSAAIQQCSARINRKT